MRMPTASELVLSTAQLALSLAADAIARGADLDQAQLAIDTADALVPVIERIAPEGGVRQYKRAVAELQLAYAEAIGPAQPAEPGRPAAEQTPTPGVETPPRPK